MFISTFVVQILGIIYKVPLTNIFKQGGRGYFSTAYALYIPLYAISMGGLPVAVSRMVSENATLGKFRDVRRIQLVARRIFLLTGSVGTLFMCLFAYPYVKIIHQPGAIPSIFMIAPCILLCCIMSSYRGFYEGLGNMIPTATSRVIESLGKMVVGVIAAYFAVYWLNREYASKGTVMGVLMKDQVTATDAISSWAAAMAILAVTVGTFFALIYLYFYQKKNGDGITREQLQASPKPESGTQIAKLLVLVAIPMVITSLINNLSNLIDTITVQNRLMFACKNGGNVITSMYSGMLSADSVARGAEGISNQLWGEYSTMLDFKNIIPTITQALGISVLPALTSLWALKNGKKIKSTVDSVLRVVMFIALPGGFGMAALSGPILDVFYRKLETGTGIMSPMLAVYGYGIFLIALSAPVTSMLQAIGRTDVPIKSMLAGSVVKIILNYVLISIPSINIKGAPYSTLLMYAVMMGYNLFMLCRITGYRPRIEAVFLKPAAAAAISSFSAWGVNYFVAELVSPTAAVFVAICSAVVVYSLAMILLRAVTKQDILMLPKGEKIAKRLEKYQIIG